MKALYDVKAAAQALAVSHWTIRAYIRAGKLKAVRLGRLVRLREEELERFLIQAQAQNAGELERFVAESHGPAVKIQKGQENANEE